jgi:hypothetical protein
VRAKDASWRGGLLPWLQGLQHDSKGRRGALLVLDNAEELLAAAGRKQDNAHVRHARFCLRRSHSTRALWWLGDLPLALALCCAYARASAAIIPCLVGTQERLGELVRHLLGASPALDVIVASRSAFPLPFAAQCPLDRMPPNEAVALLKAAGAGQVAVSDEQAGRIAELCGFNALELSLVGGLLGGRSCTPEVRPFWGCVAATVQDTTTYN